MPRSLNRVDEVIRSSQIRRLRSDRIKVLHGHHRNRADSTAGKTTPNALAGPFAVFTMECAGHVYYHTGTPRKFSERVGNRLGHRFVLDALGPVVALGGRISAGTG